MAAKGGEGRGAGAGLAPEAVGIASSEPTLCLVVGGHLTQHSSIRRLGALASSRSISALSERREGGHHAAAMVQ